MAALRVNISDCRYRALIGVGGIGSGRFFALKGDHTLGREESRAGRFLPNRDYCKLHIISHYVKRLLGPAFATILIGKVGDDDIGRRLLQEMQDAGLDLRYVRICAGEETLFSVSFIYPDGSGGNLTTDDSACHRVDAASVAEAEPEFERFRGRGVALAAPEVPLSAREKLLQLGTEYRFLRVASFVSAEIGPVIEMGLLSHVDLLAINIHEAAAAAEMSEEDSSPESIVALALGRLREINSRLLVSITAGKRGSWSWDGKALTHVPAFPVEVVSTAGAGDAHLAGVMVGLVTGLAMPKAQELGSLVAALAITSPHTIHPEIDRQSLHAFATGLHAPLTDALRSLLAG
jgi:sugar/nucleoside kinase (ribokinase family)